MSVSFPLSPKAEAALDLKGALSLGNKAPDAQGIKEAAQKFEAIFIRQMLAAARSTDFGGEKLLDGPGLKQFNAMQDENFADIMAKNGGLGFAKIIEAQLSARLSEKSATTGQPAGSPFPISNTKKG